MLGTGTLAYRDSPNMADRHSVQMILGLEWRPNEVVRHLLANELVDGVVSQTDTDWVQVRLPHPLCLLF